MHQGTWAWAEGTVLDAGKSVCKMIDQGQAGQDEMQSKTKCRRPGRLIFDCKKG